MTPVGTCCIVLHSHLPWLAHHGSWPVGEEWLFQAWAASYLPLLEMLDELAFEGRSDLLTLGVTPVLAAMLDDPYCLRQFHTWLGDWAVRAEGALVAGLPVAGYEGGLATAAMRGFEARWRHGASPVLRPLVDAGVIEVLGGPATHTYTPLLPPALADFALRTGLDDATLRLGRRPEGIWAPECAYAPGLEDLYQTAGVRRFVVDGPTVHGRTGAPVDVAGSGVLAFARDLDVSYRVWSPRAGYPGHGDYRDFHTFDHASGLRPARVTSTRTAPQDKRGYEPAAARAVAARHAEEFVGHVRARLISMEEPDPLVVAAWDTELFGHWWHEGPAFLGAVLRLLPEAGVRVASLRTAGERLPARKEDLPAGSWGSGKDDRVWQVPDLRELQEGVTQRLLGFGAGRAWQAGRDEARDQLAREALLALASDWPFAVTKDSAAGYARDRAHAHAAEFHAIADALERGDPAGALVRARAGAVRDDPFGHLDARGLGAAQPGPAGR